MNVRHGARCDQDALPEVGLLRWADTVRGVARKDRADGQEPTRLPVSRSAE
jgi:hypothetical protein